ncbi:conjugal transfer protein TraC [Agrobacterium sp. V1]|uniref:conjugal transfer protein TraC n=1 Tax=Agrobacterium sp. V1 TaxID=3061957 RepID=UPI002672D74D|nr:conjugal transfer protein TraC [Agrobacterium sp. V1]MDO3445449.1 TraC family protein [Agrobacterium sp. V1]
MKKPSSRIREEIARLQEQLKLAETREAERIGRVALRAGVGEIEVDENQLQAAFEDLAKRFRASKPGRSERSRADQGGTAAENSDTVAAGAAAGISGKA